MGTNKIFHISIKSQFIHMTRNNLQLSTARSKQDRVLSIKRLKGMFNPQAVSCLAFLKLMQLSMIAAITDNERNRAEIAWFWLLFMTCERRERQENGLCVALMNVHITNKTFNSFKYLAMLYKIMLMFATVSHLKLCHCFTLQNFKLGII